MVRRAAVLGLAGVLVAAAGCRHPCGDRGWFAGFGRGPAPGSLTGRSAEACDVPGVPMSGGGLPPGAVLVPGSAAGPTQELPPPTGYIPPVGLPLAPPMAAPADTMGTLPPPKVGTPVKGGN